MKNSFQLTGAAFLLLALNSCQNKDVFTVSGTIKNAGANKKVYLLEADTTQLKVVDSVAVAADGGFKFERTSPVANLFKLRAGTAIFDLIAKNGENIKFETDLDDKAHVYTVTGSDESEKIKEFNAVSNVTTEANAKLYDEYQTKLEATHKEDSLNRVFQPLFMKNISEYSQQILAFVDKNKNSLAAFYAATSLDPYKYEAQMVAYADGISADMKKNPTVKRFTEQMDVLRPISIGHKAPDFTMNLIDGKPVKLSDYKGKYVMLDFWASWCGPCREENPNLVKQYAIYKEKGLNILGISLDEKKADWQKAITDDGLTWSHASELKKFDGPTERLYHIEAIPSNFIIDPQGIIIAKNLTRNDLANFLSKTFSKP